MDLSIKAIECCLAISPVPYLGTAFAILKFVYSSIRQTQVSRRQLTSLTASAAQLLGSLHGEYQAGHLSQSKTSEPLHKLLRLLEEISTFVQKQSLHSFLKSIYIKEQLIAQIESYQHQIEALVMSFQISSLLDIHDWQSRNDRARVLDQTALSGRLDDLENNQKRLLDSLNANQSNMLAMMVSLQKHLAQGTGADRERQFLAHTLVSLSRISGRQIKAESWTVTSFDVEFGEELRCGGFGKIYRGTWNGTEVALKVLRTDGHIAASSELICKEIRIWSTVLHPHVLQFLGANVLDDRPFIVMPYRRNGNARDYLECNPQCDRRKILNHILLGLVHLHSKNIIHGDLKASNVLIDDSETAQLCDFGLSRVKMEVTTRIASSGGATVNGSRNWMAPELLSGGRLRKPCDIYSLGLTIFEVYTGETPLGNIDYGDFIELVVRQNVRPSRPEADEMQGDLPDEVWELAERCWVAEPNKRPDVQTACNAIGQYALQRLPSVVEETFTTQLPKARGRAPPTPPPSTSRPLPTPPMAPINTLNGTLSRGAVTPSTPKRRISNVSIPQYAMYGPLFNPSISNLSVASDSTQRTVMSRWLPWPSSNSSSIKLKGHTGKVFAVAFSHHGRRVASGAMDSTVRIWDVATGHPMGKPLRGLGGNAYSVDFSPDDRTIIAGGGDGKILVWDVEMGEIVLGPLMNHRKAVRSVKFSPDGRRFVSGSWDGTIVVWNATTGYPILPPLAAHDGYICSVAFSPNGQRVASCSLDKSICIWDSISGKRVGQSLNDHTEGVRCVAYSPDGNRLASCAKDNTVRIWNVERGVVIAGPFKDHKREVLGVCFSKDGKYVAACSADRTICVWEVATERLTVGPVKLHKDDINSVAFSPDGARIVSGSSDMTVCIYTLP